MPRWARRRRRRRRSARRPRRRPAPRCRSARTPSRSGATAFALRRPTRLTSGIARGPTLAPATASLFLARLRSFDSSDRTLAGGRSRHPSPFPTQTQNTERKAQPSRAYLAPTPAATEAPFAHPSSSSRENSMAIDRATSPTAPNRRTPPTPTSPTKPSRSARTYRPSDFGF